MVMIRAIGGIAAAIWTEDLLKMRAAEAPAFIRMNDRYIKDMTVYEAEKNIRAA